MKLEGCEFHGLLVLYEDEGPCLMVQLQQTHSFFRVNVWGIEPGRLDYGNATSFIIVVVVLDICVEIVLDSARHRLYFLKGDL